MAVRLLLTPVALALAGCASLDGPAGIWTGYLEGCELGTGEPIDCLKLALCDGGSSVCTCDAVSCGASALPPSVEADLHFGGDSLDGTVTGVGRVRLAR